MSLNEVAESVKLDITHTFDHRRIVRDEIDHFKDAFERNDRSLEFDGLIRKNHKIYEANETQILPFLQTTTMKSLISKIDSATKRLARLAEPQFSAESLKKINLMDLSQSEILKLAEQHVQRKNAKNVNTMEKIIETE